MRLDIKKLDEWLLNNPDYSQEEREVVLEALIDYERSLNGYSNRRNRGKQRNDA